MMDRITITLFQFGLGACLFGGLFLIVALEGVARHIDDIHLELSAIKARLKKEDRLAK